LLSLSKSEECQQKPHLYADFGYPVTPAVQPRLFKPTKGSGVLLDRGVYPISLALTLLGSVKKVSATIVKTEQGVDTHADLLLTHESGNISVLSVSVDALLQNKAVLSFPTGAYILEQPAPASEQITTKTYWLSNEPLPASTVSVGLKDKLKQSLKQITLLRKIKAKKSAGKSQFYSYGKNQYLPVLEHFIDLLQAGKKQSPLIPLSHSAEVLRVIELAKKTID